MIKFIVFLHLVECRRCLFYMSLLLDILPPEAREKDGGLQPESSSSAAGESFTQIYLSQRQNKHLKINSMTKTKACARAAFFQQLRDICTAVDLRRSPPPPARHAKQKFYTNIFIATAK